jgi:ABC-2 type transport system ATP-binding protein
VTAGNWVIEAEGLRKVFGRKVAVADLSLRVAAGEVFGFLGPNGAGKTTAMKMLLGLVHPTAGRGFVLGHPVGSREARRWVGFLPEHFRFHDWMTGRELLDFHGQLHGLPADRARRAHRDPAGTGGFGRCRRPPGRHLQQGHAAAAGTRPGAHPSAQTRLSR